MKRIKINTTWEEDEEERRQFFAALSYSERLRYCFQLRNKFNFNKPTKEKNGYLKFTIHMMPFDSNGRFISAIKV